ncbi:hypothetical protein SBV1_820033 [Verrucomicrobia bacterium]|nr:hypothetical protein SBV1_820033 [Verrucomicrobiota bacterium]
MKFMKTPLVSLVRLKIDATDCSEILTLLTLEAASEFGNALPRSHARRGRKPGRNRRYKNTASAFSSLVLMLGLFACGPINTKGIESFNVIRSFVVSYGVTSPHSTF